MTLLFIFGLITANGSVYDLGTFGGAVEHACLWQEKSAGHYLWPSEQATCRNHLRVVSILLKLRIILFGRKQGLDYSQLC